MLKLIHIVGEKLILENLVVLRTDNVKLFGLEHTVDQENADVPITNLHSEPETD